MLLLVAAALLAQEPTTTLPPEAAVKVPCVDVDAHAELKRAHAVLAAYADQGRGERVTGAVANGALAAGLIGAGITYVAVAHLDGNLSRLNAQDTELAGFVAFGAAVVPAVVMVTQIALPSPAEQRLADFEATGSTDGANARSDDERIAAARASLVDESQRSTWPAMVGGTALVVGGLGAGGLGAYFLLLPHLENPRGVVTHGTGAELIGGGVAALGVGVAVLVGSGSNAGTQLQLLE